MSKPWPYTSAEQLETAGYKFVRASRCSGKYRGGTCNALLHFYSTPDKKQIPLDPQTFAPHHSTCPDVELFRKLKGTKTHAKT